MTKQEKQMEIIKGVGRMSEDKLETLYYFIQGINNPEGIKTEVKNYINSNTISADMMFRLEADTLDAINKDLAQFQNEMFNNPKGLNFEITSYNVKKNERNVTPAYEAIVGFRVFLDSNTIKAMNEGKIIF
jgi:hypothetical protein